jgi:hypothetical protein
LGSKAAPPTGASPLSRALAKRSLPPAALRGGCVTPQTPAVPRARLRIASPYRETPKNSLKEIKQNQIRGWLIPQNFIKYTSRSGGFFLEGPLESCKGHSKK